MKHELEFLLLKLSDGGRLLRVSEPISGLCLEKRLELNEPVKAQQERWTRVFAQLIEQELSSPG